MKKQKKKKQDQYSKKKSLYIPKIYNKMQRASKLDQRKNKVNINNLNYEYK